MYISTSIDHRRLIEACWCFGDLGGWSFLRRRSFLKRGRFLTLRRPLDSMLEQLGLVLSFS